MPNFRRNYVCGGTYFLTVVLKNRTQSYLTEYINEFRTAYHETLQYLPFDTNAICILPDHFHLLMTLPENDNDFSNRIRNLKFNFSKRIPKHIRTPNTGQQSKQESSIWQSRFWEHTIRDEQDFLNHVHYIYYNPVKHGYVTQVKDWQYSSFHRDVAENIFPENWGGNLAENIVNLYHD